MGSVWFRDWKAGAVQAGEAVGGRFRNCRVEQEGTAKVQGSAAVSRGTQTRTGGRSKGEGGRGGGV